jgi:hypothetical protein
MIRTIADDSGRQWDITVGRESYGMQMLLFFPKDGGGVRKAMMTSITRLDADRELAELDEATLRERLAQSVPWESPTPFGG